MKKKILLVNPKSNLDFFFSNPPPLGLLYLISYLRDKNIEAEIIDINIKKNWLKALEKKIFEFNPNYVGISSNIANVNNAHFLAKHIKKINDEINIILGGPYPTSSPEDILRNKSVDIVCVGEGEQTLYEYIKNGKNTSGLMFRKDSSLHFTGARDFIPDLNKLPFPALEEVNLKKYWVNLSKASPISIIMTSRGCPYGCTFCFHGVHGYKWRARSPKNVIKEMNWQINELGANELCVWDDNFTLDLERVHKICRLIKENNLKFPWQCPNGLRVDKLNYNLLKEMKSTGFWKLALSPESGDPKILEKVCKGFTLKQVKIVNDWCKELDIFVIMDFIFGFPWEDELSTVKTINAAFKFDPEIISFYKLNVFPKTKLYEMTKGSTFINKGYFECQLEEDVEKAYKRAYLRFYLRPRKMVELIKKISPKDFIKLSIRASKLKLKGYI